MGGILGLGDGFVEILGFMGGRLVVLLGIEVADRSPLTAEY